MLALIKSLNFFPCYQMSPIQVISCTGWWRRLWGAWKRSPTYLLSSCLLRLPASHSLGVLAPWRDWTLFLVHPTLSFVMQYSFISEILLILPRSLQYSILIGHIPLQFLQRMHNLTILELNCHIYGSLSIFVEHLEQIASTIWSQHSKAIHGVVDCAVV